MKQKFETKDSGNRQDYKSGMRRDIEEDKPQWDLVPLCFWDGWTAITPLSQHTTMDTNFSTIIREYAVFSRTNLEKGGWVNVSVPQNIIEDMFTSIVVSLIKIEEATYGDASQPDIIRRYRELLERGAKKYGAHNYQLANSKEEADRFFRSGFRHLMQFLNQDRDEDHLAAVIFNIVAYAMCLSKLEDNE
jgi:hypothetical protein